MQVKAPITRRTFRHKWDEMSYRLGKGSYQLFQRHSIRNARPHVLRLRQLLVTSSGPEATIIGRSASALVAEFEGRWQKALSERRAAVRLVIRLYRSAFKHDEATREFLLQKLHKPMLVKRLYEIRAFWKVRASGGWAQKFDSVIATMKGAKEPANPGKRGCRRGKGSPAPVWKALYEGLTTF
jgi:hypothetical protein